MLRIDQRQSFVVSTSKRIRTLCLRTRRLAIPSQVELPAYGGLPLARDRESPREQGGRDVERARDPDDRQEEPQHRVLVVGTLGCIAEQSRNDETQPSADGEAE